MNTIRLFSKHNITVILILMMSLTSCDLINPSEDAPGYVVVEKFDFNPTPSAAEFGSSSSTKIKDVWVFIDNEFLGSYELPARFPSLKTGSHRVILSPGIMLNGISTTRSPYPFYEASIHEVVIPELGEVTISPSTSYFESADCAFCESFEGSGFSLSSTSNSDTTMSQLPVGDPNIFEGNSSGVVYLDTSNTQFEITSTSEYNLPNSNSAVFLELDYKINQSMQVGLFVMKPNVASEQIPVITLNPTTTWNKIYIQLGYVVSSYNSSTTFKIYFGALKDPSVSNPAFYLDNIKVVHF